MSSAIAIVGRSEKLERVIEKRKKKSFDRKLFE